MNQTIRRILCGVLCIVLAGMTACTNVPQAKPEESGTPQLEPITLVLDWAPNTNHTGIYVAEAKGYYKNAGLSVTIQQPPEDGAYALTASGKAQFCIGFQESLAIALTADSPLELTAVAAIIQHNTSGLISAKDKGIDTFGKLAGHSYATWETPLELAMIDYVMKKEGASIDQVSLIPSTVTDAVSAIQSNVDSVWVYEAWDVMAAKVAGVDYNFLRFSDVDPVLDFYTPVLVADSKFLQENPEAAKAFVEATAKGYEDAIANPKEAAEILHAAVPELPLELLTESQAFLAEAYKAEQPSWGKIDQTRWAGFYDWMYEQKLIPKPLGNQGFTNEFLPS